MLHKSENAKSALATKVSVQLVFLELCTQNYNVWKCEGICLQG